MAVMNEEQSELLQQLEHVRAEYELFEEALAQEVIERKHEAKRDIRRLVREARAADVPYRRIGIAIQTSDHRTIKEYEKEEVSID